MQPRHLDARKVALAVVDQKVLDVGQERIILLVLADGIDQERCLEIALEFPTSAHRWLDTMHNEEPPGTPKGVPQGWMGQQLREMQCFVTVIGVVVTEPQHTGSLDLGSNGSQVRWIYPEGE